MVYENYKQACRYLSTSFEKFKNWRKQAKLKKCLKIRPRLDWIMYYETETLKSV